MHAWAALKPADIVQAAQTLRDMFTGVKPSDETQGARAAAAPPEDDGRAEGSAPAE